MKNHELIFLTGMMGAGKTKVGEKLAQSINYDWIDLDKVIEKRYQKKIKDIFIDSGEKFFREIERKQLEDLFKVKKTVISLGGGALSDDFIVSEIKKKGILIYLQCFSSILSTRLSIEEKPLLFGLSKNQVLKKLRKVQSQRKEKYKQAHYTVHVSKMTENEVVRFILDEIL
tara:strand:+ start:243 stop:758 length:516 start_codon:yes stop_codon:yes gene_type:complete